jgi:hypothetical protein
MKKILVIFISLFFLGSFFLFSNSSGSQFIKSFIPSQLKDFLKNNLFYIPSLISENRKLKNETTDLYSKIEKLSLLKNTQNENFFPITQFLKLSYFEISLDNIKSEFKYERYGDVVNPVYLEIYDNHLILASKDGKLFYEKINNILDKNLKLNAISTNLSNKIEITDLLIYKEYLYVALVNKDKDLCNIPNLNIFRARIDFKNLEFENIFKQKNYNNIKVSKEDCGFAPTGGVLEIYKKDNKEYLIFSAEGSIDYNKKTKENIKNNNNFLKTDKSANIYSLELKNKNIQLISTGHRNPLGLVVTKDNNILSTEHGPRGGDEINLITKGGNFGWPAVSYGEPYSTDYNSIYYYKKDHEKYGFIEPIYSFIPSIGVSRIIEVNNNFSEKWENNFLITSLKKRSMYRVEFDKSYRKIKYIEAIVLGKRIRDIIYSPIHKIFFLTLEDGPGYLGVMSNK